MKIIIVRHAEAEGNYKRVFQGWTDGAITKKGHKQAELAAKALEKEKIDLIFSSSSLRTCQTAEYISKIKNLPIIKDENLREIYGGDWEGQRWDDLSVLWPEECNTWENYLHKHKMPNGESMIEFSDRIVGAFEKIVQENYGKDLCIVTHGTAIRVLLCHAYGYKFEKMDKIIWFDNTAITILENNNSIYKILREGDIFHLGKEYSTLNTQEWWSEYVKKYNDRKKEIIDEKLRGRND